jgi:hypothetical protein
MNRVKVRRRELAQRDPLADQDGHFSTPTC